MAVPLAQELRSLFDKPRHGSMTDSVTDALREAILAGVLEPLTWLREDELAQALGVSRTPVREALRRLSDEGLTRHVPNRGSVVEPMTVEDIFAVYAVRETLEGFAARQAAARHQPALIAELTRVHRAMVDAENKDQFAALNLDFHRAISRATGNSYIERFLLQIEYAIRRFGQTTFSMPGRMSTTLEEHYAILQAIAAGDGDLAERSASDHIRRSREARMHQLLSNQGRGVGEMVRLADIAYNGDETAE